MSDNVIWIATTRDLYAVIYAVHIDQFGVFGTISNPEDGWHGERHMMTEWGFKTADYPLIKHEERGTPPVHRYFIAAVKETPNAS